MSDIGNGTEVLAQKWLGNTNPATCILRSRDWCFTINNPSDQEWTIVRSMDCKYICYAPEIGKEGTPHIQGYVMFKGPKRLSEVKKILTRAHLEPRRGNHDQAVQYIKGPHKEKPINADFEERGDPPTQGKRNDLRKLYDEVRKGRSRDDILDDTELIEVRAKYPRYERELREDVANRVARQMQESGIVPNVTVLWGPTGTGKTRYVFDRHPIKDVSKHVSRKPMWWDGYDGQPVILLDEFDGQLDFRELLQLLDRYTYHMPIKGGFTWRRCTHIYITANTPPEMWYPAENISPLMRRINEIIEMK